MKTGAHVSAIGCRTSAGALAIAPVPARDATKYLSQPRATASYTADPSAHVFGGKMYIYPSDDFNGSTPEHDLGAHFEMRDYRVPRLDRPGGKVTVGPVALDVKDVPWAENQMWVPDAAYKAGTCPDGTIRLIDPFIK
jgi:hypothetical protein